eukprot:TRINITY_DN67479_c0_g1_i1.p1 TRINITY_DN67479_c0_g1~~TRINITY_DN67479_c0_g1_i1.p1  ORF type:complete len:606 (-),score=136.97 TRINITY_DN67479_c0_g1_i1:51-1868(-)
MLGCLNCSSLSCFKGLRPPLRIRLPTDEDASTSRSKTPKERASSIQLAASPGGSSCRAVDAGRILWDVHVEERYALGEGNVLGQGTFGTVSTVIDRRTQAKRAMKSAKIRDEEQLEEFIQEAKVHLQVDHPNVCKLLEVYVGEDACHLIMEVCSGRELYERWAVKGTYSEEEAAVAVSQMLSALCYLHSHRVCHRDLKLENWVYKDELEDSKLKLIDFGFSKVLMEDVPMTAILGTIFYMAPEVIQGSYDFKCDVWSTGIVLYLLLSGDPPFYDKHCNDWTVQKILHDPLCMEESPWDDISEEAKHFVQQLLQRDVESRPSALEASRHPWLCGEGEAMCRTASAKQRTRSTLEQLQSFASMSVMKRATCGLMSFAMSVDESDLLEKEFKTLDKEGNGSILVHELVEALIEHLGMTEGEAVDLFDKLDLTGDKEIKYSEFLAAANQQHMTSEESLVRQAFARFDVDGTGFISADNLRQIFGGDNFHGTKVEDIIRQVDYKQTGVIDYDEFLEAIADLGPNDVCSKGDRTMSRAFEFTSAGSHQAPHVEKQPAMVYRKSGLPLSELQDLWKSLVMSERQASEPPASSRALSFRAAVGKSRPLSTPAF